MPIYEFRCRECGRIMEKILRHGARQPRTCEHCSGRLEKLISRTSFHLKGGGWYDDGYGGGAGGKKEGDKAKGKPKPSESKPSDSKPSDSKPSKKSAKSSGKSD